MKMSGFPVNDYFAARRGRILLSLSLARSRGSHSFVHSQEIKLSLCTVLTYKHRRDRISIYLVGFLPEVLFIISLSPLDTITLIYDLMLNFFYR